MYWGDELVAIYNEAYIGKYYFSRCPAIVLMRVRTGRPKTPSFDGPELQSRLGRDLG